MYYTIYCNGIVSNCSFSTSFPFQIAIKIIDKREASQDFLTKFLPREISALRRLNHPNVIHVFRMVETNLQVYFMLEIAQNGDLLDYINMRRVLPEPEARFVLRSISAGIAHCHSKGIVHRDLKCENIMLTKDMDVKIGGVFYIYACSYNM